ncbi:MAG TPA: putative sugar O-methyltransferase [Prolixibacteraceae bacterium]|jgi:putative sugar O-methyltransferase
MQNLDKLIKEYKNAPEIFQAGRYWKAYEDKIASEIKSADIEQLRSGKYPIFGTFGFCESVYNYSINMPLHTKVIKKIIRKLFISNKATLPYSLRLSDIREMAYNHCILQGQLAHAKSISEIETSTFGNPSDLFEMKGKKYTMQFLNFYIRFCFAQQYLNLKGDETIVELGSGSGFQVEILKKIFPNLTILCFDLPAPLYLCEQYLSKALGESQVVKSDRTIDATDLKAVVEKGKVHMFGNWMFPLLKTFPMDVFWNGASFGEMEPEIAKNYLSYIKEHCKSVYLLQARNGKESSKSSGVVTPIKFSDYNAMLDGFQLIKESDAFEANRRMSQSGGYFQAVWQKEKV